MSESGRKRACRVVRVVRSGKARAVALCRVEKGLRFTAKGGEKKRGRICGLRREKGSPSALTALDNPREKEAPEPEDYERRKSTYLEPKDRTVSPGKRAHRSCPKKRRKEKKSIFRSREGESLRRVFDGGGRDISSKKQKKGGERCTSEKKTSELVDLQRSVSPGPKT